MTMTLEEFLSGEPQGAVAMFRGFRDLVLAAGESEERVHPTEVAWARRRVFAAAFLKSGRLEIAIDLLREASHPLLLQAFPTTKKVVTHRLTISDPDQLDDSIAALLDEAWATVGPGTR
ncbi:DUF5655 domain-containing protein [Plantibacter sp. YIM 135249]|uniref:DUF5655 domain-containing protein n=1 Tax=Plantibacter sp. YIM 135249 TaxID=3423918 RepID=UPI003D34E066